MTLTSGECFNGVSFSYSVIPLSYFDAQAECLSLEGSLVSQVTEEHELWRNSLANDTDALLLWLDSGSLNEDSSESLLPPLPEIDYSNGKTAGAVTVTRKCLVSSAKEVDCNSAHHYICQTRCAPNLTETERRERHLQGLVFEGCIVNQELYFNTVQRNFFVANDECALFGGPTGRLVIPNSIERLNAINSFTGSRGFGGSRWIGLIDFAGFGGNGNAKRFLAVNGQQNPFTHLASTFPWNGAEPNDSGSEDCGEIISNNLFNDIPCGVGRPYICERYCGVIPDFNFGLCVGNIQYYFSDQLRTFSAAQADCETQDPLGTLAIPDSLSTFERIRDLYLNNKPSDTAAWVGLRDFARVGGPGTARFLDMNGNVPAFTNVGTGNFPWSGGEPNDLTGQKCGNLFPTGLLDDKACTNALFSVCQRPCVSNSPTPAPSQSPIKAPTLSPSESPSKKPTSSPTPNPTDSPSPNPTKAPTRNPTGNPTSNPTASPTQNPTNSPSPNPTNSPSENPTDNPTSNPTESPSLNPTRNPTLSPTDNPTESPTFFPTENPTFSPTFSPTDNPTISPTLSPTFTGETLSPTPNPTESPILAADGCDRRVFGFNNDIES